MNFTETPKTLAWPPTHYVFVERVGPFQTNAPQAWQSFHQLVGVAEHNQHITGYMSAYKVGPQISRGRFTRGAAGEVVKGSQLHPIRRRQIQSLRFDRTLFGSGQGKRACAGDYLREETAASGRLVH